MYLAGDIGGTKTHLAIYEEKGGVYKPIREDKFPSKDYSNLNTIAKKFLNVKNEKIKKACFGIAGPITNNVCRATNLPWVIDAKEIASDLGITSVGLINDLEANAYGIKTLKEEDFFVLNKGVPEQCNQALISAGTGLGEAGLYWNKKEHIPFACEGGHCDFSPRNKEEVDLFYYLQKKFGTHISFERVLSGPGLENLYHYLVDTKKEIAAFPEEMNPKSLAKCITEKGLAKSCPASVKALDWFVSLYGSEAANAALKFYALGGVYLGGGIAPKILEKFKTPIFMRAFIEKGRFEKLLSLIPVKIVLNEDTALLGSAYYASHYL